MYTVPGTQWALSGGQALLLCPASHPLHVFFDLSQPSGNLLQVIITMATKNHYIGIFRKQKAQKPKVLNPWTYISVCLSIQHIDANTVGA